VLLAVTLAARGIIGTLTNMHAPNAPTAAERALRADPQPLADHHDGRLAGRLIALCRELQRDAGDGQPFSCPVRFAQSFLRVGQIAQASGLLRTLEFRGILQCVRRGTMTRGEIRGLPTLYRFKEPK